MTSKEVVSLALFSCHQPKAEDDDPEPTQKSERIKHTMDYESFKEKFVEDLKDRLDEQGVDVKVSVNTVNKLNESYEAVTVTPEGSNIGVNIGIDKFYDAMENGRSYDEVVDKAVEVVNSGITQRPDFDSSMDRPGGYEPSNARSTRAGDAVAVADLAMQRTVTPPYVGSNPISHLIAVGRDTFCEYETLSIVLRQGVVDLRLQPA